MFSGRDYYIKCGLRTDLVPSLWARAKRKAKHLPGEAMQVFYEFRRKATKHVSWPEQSKPALGRVGMLGKRPT